MKTNEIDELKLGGRSIAFRNVSEFLGKDFRDHPFVFDGVLFGVCIRGTATVKIDYREYTVAADSIVVVLPKHICSVKDCSCDLDMRVVMVSSDFLCRLPIVPDFNLLKRVLVRPCVGLDAEKREDMLKIHSLIGRYCSDDRLSVQIRDTLVHSMILVTASSFGNPDSDPSCSFTRQEILVRRFFDLLMDSCETERSVSYYADRLCVTPKHLTAVVKAVTNHPVRSWINEAVVISAKRYVMTTDLTVHQIADRLGFLTASSFVRFFRIHAGCSPLDYRKSMNQDL